MTNTATSRRRVPIRNSSDRFSARRDRFARFCRSEKVDAFLVTSDVNVSYLTGFSGEDSHLLVSAEKCVLVSDSRFTQQIEEECPGLETYIRRPGQQMDEAVARVIRSSRYRSVGFESTSMTVAGWEKLQKVAKVVQWRGVAGAVEELRMIKDSDEVRQIREAISIAERAFSMFRSSLRPIDNEKNLSDALEAYIRHAGGICGAFPAIVAVGPRSALPHAVPTEQQCEGSEFLLVDWGARGRFYHSDLTRILVTGKVSRKLARVYEVVRKAQLRAIRAIKPGVTGGQVDAAARGVIAKAGFGRYFGHGLGHGLGMQVHEAPALRKESKTKLKAGMVVTVEPGIYLKGWGGVRLEDDVLVTRDGCEVLTSLPNCLEESIALS